MMIFKILSLLGSLFFFIPYTQIPREFKSVMYVIYLESVGELVICPF